MPETFTLIVCSTQPDFSAEAEGLHKSYYTIFACPSTHPDSDQLFADTLAEHHLAILQEGSKVTVVASEISADVMAQINQFGRGISLTAMTYPKETGYDDE
jgi:hypothetical protein